MLHCCRGWDGEFHCLTDFTSISELAEGVKKGGIWVGVKGVRERNRERPAIGRM